MFNVELDFGSVFDGTELWLEIEVGGTTLGSRQNLTPTPHALYAANAAAVEQTPVTPVLVGSIAVGGSPRQVHVAGRYAYVTDDRGALDGLLVIDVADPTNPRQLGSVQLNSITDGLFASGRYVYVSARGTGAFELSVVDVSDPTNPVAVGTAGNLNGAIDVHVSGRYAYVADQNDLEIYDISQPTAPSRVSQTTFGSAVVSVAVSGVYAYLTDYNDGALRIVDVSDPTAPSLEGTLLLTSTSSTVAVSDSLAFVFDVNDLVVIDVSDPKNPSTFGSVTLGSDRRQLVAAGRYVYALRQASLEIVDVVDPTDPTIVGVLPLTDAYAHFVAGGYLYVLDSTAEELRVYDLFPGQLPSLIAGSLEAGQVQVRNNLVVGGELQVESGLNVGAGGIYSDGDMGLSGTLALANDTAPTVSPADLVQLYAEDVATSSELRVRDEAGNITTLSPHNFSLVGGPSEPMAWSYYSENEHGRINVDMLRALRLLERLSGEHLVHIDSDTASDQARSPLVRPLLDRIEELESRNQILESQLERVIQELEALLEANR